jgi:hypothetical protein
LRASCPATHPDRNESIAIETSTVDTDASCQLEAARYALLRRLAPAFRHRLVGGLHPIELVAEAVQRRLLAAVPDLDGASESLRKIKNLSQSALLTCVNLTAWLAPEEKEVTMLGEGIDECLALLHTEFDMRGFAIRNQAREIGVDLSSSALRNVLTAALIAAADNAPGPADLVLTAEISQRYAVLSIAVSACDRVADIADAAAYRSLDWNDVGALAQDESVELLRQDNRITMRYAIAGH